MTVITRDYPETDGATLDEAIDRLGERITDYERDGWRRRSLIAVCRVRGGLWRARIAMGPAIDLDGGTWKRTEGKG